MRQAYRLGFEFTAPEEASDVKDARWSLASLDPASRIRTGAFAAPDGEAVPYRLRRADAPRALALLLHWKHNALVLDRIFSWLEPRLTAKPGAYNLTPEVGAIRAA